MEICRGCRLYDQSGSGCSVPGTSPCCNENMSEMVGDKEIKGCGCSLSLKGRSLASECPLGKWKAVLTLKEEEILNKQLNDQG